MLGRLPNKDTPTNMPPELLNQIADVFNSQFSSSLIKEEKEIFRANILIYQEEIVLILSLLKPGKIKNLNLYASIEYIKEKVSINDANYYLIDCIGFYLDEYFKSNRSIMLPNEWAKYEIETKNVYMKYDTENTLLEKIGDDIIKKNQNLSSSSSLKPS